MVTGRFACPRQAAMAPSNAPCGRPISTTPPSASRLTSPKLVISASIVIAAPHPCWKGKSPQLLFELEDPMIRRQTALMKIHFGIARMTLNRSAIPPRHLKTGQIRHHQEPVPFAETKLERAPANGAGQQQKPHPSTNQLVCGGCAQPAGHLCQSSLRSGWLWR